MITDSRQITEHFHSTEFRCQHCGNIKIEEELVNKMETLFAKLHASKCIISSGYRCPDYDIQIGGFAGRHSEGLAADCIYYAEDGSIIPSKIVICVANDLGIFNGIANIDGNYVHLDNRKGSTYKGDEPRGNGSYWTNPYDYFGVSKEEVRKYTKEEDLKPIDVVAREVIEGVYGNQPERQQRLEALGYNYQEVQDKVNAILNATQPGLSIGDKVIIVATGNGASDGSANTAYGLNWERSILDIHNGAAFPYQVGDSTGTTGFYKADALKKV